MSHPRITVYQKPTCTTCRKLFALLTEAGVDFDRVDYFVEPLSRAQLQRLLKKAGLKPRDVLRTKAPQYAELGLADPSVADARLLDLLVAHPDLLQRPIVERGERAVLARPPERVREIL
ncbi:MAG: arsenate reductase (glutaredoxin) [Gemmatimonadetes bacterium]|nr:arsenate reductase (glutaredoxin) [Gemmatimonadota bacterium]